MTPMTPSSAAGLSLSMSDLIASAFTECTDVRSASYPSPGDCEQAPSPQVLASCSSCFELSHDRRGPLAGLEDLDVFESEPLSWPPVWVVGRGDEFDQNLIADLLSHGYVETEAAKAGSVSARFLVAG